MHFVIFGQKLFNTVGNLLSNVNIIIVFKLTLHFSPDLKCVFSTNPSTTDCYSASTSWTAGLPSQIIVLSFFFKFLMFIGFLFSSVWFMFCLVPRGRLKRLKRLKEHIALNEMNSFTKLRDVTCYMGSRLPPDTS